MSSGNNLPIDPVTLESALAYKAATTSPWEMQDLFNSFMWDKPSEVVREVHAQRRFISWDLKTIQHLRRCLAIWIKDRIPGDAIGAFLVRVLCEHDYHLDYRLTTMVRELRSQEYIAHRLVTLYQVRDEAGNPIWLDLRVAEGSGAECEPKKPLKITLRVPVVEPADKRWPRFLGGLNDSALREITDKLGDDGQRVNEEDLPVVFDGVSTDEMSIIETFRRFNIHHDDCANDLPSYNEAGKIINRDTRPEAMPLPLNINNPTTAERPLPHISEYLKPLPSVSRYKKNPEAKPVRVRTFKPEKRTNVSFTPETKPGMEVPANIVQTKPRLNPLVTTTTPRDPRDPSKFLPPPPPGANRTKFYTENRARHPVLRKSKHLEDMRKIRDQHAAEKAAEKAANAF